MAFGPVADYLGRQFLLFLEGRDHPIGPDPIGFSGPGNVMQVQVGHCRSNRLTDPVDHRIVDQCHINVQARPPSPAFWLLRQPGQVILPA